MLIEIIRVENNLGIGPYSCYCFDRKHKRINDAVNMLHRLHSSLTHPGLSDDFRSNQFNFIRNNNFVFGFLNLDQYNDWFEDSKDYLKITMCNLNSYIVDSKYIRIGKSKKQIAFRKDKAKLVSSVSIS